MRNNFYMQAHLFIKRFKNNNRRIFIHHIFSGPPRKRLTLYTAKHNTTETSTYRGQPARITTNLLRLSASSRSSNAFAIAAASAAARCSSSLFLLFPNGNIFAKIDSLATTSLSPTFLFVDPPFANSFSHSISLYFFTQAVASVNALELIKSTTNLGTQSNMLTCTE